MNIIKKSKLVVKFFPLSTGGWVWYIIDALFSECSSGKVSEKTDLVWQDVNIRTYGYVRSIKRGKRRSAKRLAKIERAYVNLYREPFIYDPNTE